MKKLLLWVLALSLVFSSVVPAMAANGSQAEPVKIPIVEVTVSSRAEADDLFQAGLDVIGINHDGEVYSFMIMVQEFEREYFAANAIEYTVLQEDATAQVDWLGYHPEKITSFSASLDDLQPLPGIPGSGSGNAQPGLTIDPDAVFDPTGIAFDAKYGFPLRLGYRTVTQYYAEMNYMAMAYPNLVKKHIVGRSFEGVPMVAIEISNAPGSNDGRPGTLHQGTNHAREWPTTELALDTMWYLLSQYGKNADITELLNTTTCWFMPVTNPDGVHYDQRTNPGSWRRNRRDNGGTAANSFGVDVNRNWPFGWGSNNGSNSAITSDTYRGTAPRSEYEVQAVTSVYENNQIISSISGHTHGQLIIYAWGHRINEAGSHPLLAELGRKMADYNLHADQFSESLYAASGDLCDYAWGAMRSLHYTLEYYRSFVPNFTGTDMYRGYTQYNDLFHGTQRSFPVTYATNAAVAAAGAPTADLTAPVVYVDDPTLFRTGYGAANTVITPARIQTLGDITGKILVSPQGANANDTRDAILAAQAQGAVGVLLSGASSGAYSGGYAHYTPSFGTSGTSLDIKIPVAGTNKGYVRELFERTKAGEPNLLTLTSQTENTESMHWQFERQIGAFMANMNFAKEYASHIKGKITDGKGGLISEAALNLEVEIENLMQATNSGTGAANSPLIYLPQGTMTSTHKSVYDVKNGVYDWAVLPSKQPELAGFDAVNEDKGYTITASANGRYSDTNNVKVGWYQVAVNDVDFVLPNAISVDYDYISLTGNDAVVPFSTYELAASGQDSAKGFTGSMGELSVTVNGLPVDVISLGEGDFIAKFRVEDQNIELVIDFDGGLPHSAYQAKFELENKITPIVSLKIDTLSIFTVARGGVYNLDFILNEGASGKYVIWTIADPSLGYVDQTGTVTIFDKTGNVRLTATDPFSGVSHSITLRIAS